MPKHDHVFPYHVHKHFVDTENTIAFVSCRLLSRYLCIESMAGEEYLAKKHSFFSIAICRAIRACYSDAGIQHIKKKKQRVFQYRPTLREKR